MNVNLATVYGTQPSEEQVKLAEAELFCKIAQSQGIDLRSLDDETVSALYAEFYKAAEEEPAKEDEKKDAPPADEKKEEKEEEEKKEAAAREHATKLAHAAEEANAVKLGQIMAHAYVAEIDKIAEERRAAATPAGETKEAAGMPPQLANALGKVRGAAAKGAEKVTNAIKDKPVHSTALAGIAGYGAGRAASHFGKKKEGSVLSNIDQLALEHAVKIAHDGGFDAEEAANRVNAVATLGLEESTKVASTVDEQVGIRALEYLEAAGYPVRWDQPEQAQG